MEGVVDQDDRFFLSVWQQHRLKVVRRFIEDRRHRCVRSDASCDGAVDLVTLGMRREGAVRVIAVAADDADDRCMLDNTSSWMDNFGIQLPSLLVVAVAIIVVATVANDVIDPHSMTKTIRYTGQNTDNKLAGSQTALVG